jgi:hypothetical protein
MSPVSPRPSTVPMTDHARVERRSVPRYVAKDFPPIRVLVRPSFQPCRANVRDFSEMGLGIVCDGFLQPGAVIAIQLQRRHAGLSGILSATVAHCTPLPSGTWLCGCRLSRRLSPNEVQGLVMATPQTDDDECNEPPSYPSMVTEACRRYYFRRRRSAP